MAWMKRWIQRLRLYRLAAWLHETYRLIAKPRTHGALVALWHQGQVLLVATSYRRELSLPGGWINRGETVHMAAQRELGEPWALTERSARGVNTVTIFSVELTVRPTLQVDGLEILNYLWLTSAEALEHPITGHLHAYLLEQLVCRPGDLRTKSLQLLQD